MKSRGASERDTPPRAATAGATSRLTAAWRALRSNFGWADTLNFVGGAASAVTGVWVYVDHATEPVRAAPVPTCVSRETFEAASDSVRVPEGLKVQVLSRDGTTLEFRSCQHVVYAVPKERAEAADRYERMGFFQRVAYRAGNAPGDLVFAVVGVWGFCAAGGAVAGALRGATKAQRAPGEEG